MLRCLRMSVRRRRMSRRVMSTATSAVVLIMKSPITAAMNSVHPIMQPPITAAMTVVRWIMQPPIIEATLIGVTIVAVVLSLVVDLVAGAFLADWRVNEFGARLFEPWPSARATAAV